MNERIYFGKGIYSAISSQVLLRAALALCFFRAIGSAQSAPIALIRQAESFDAAEGVVANYGRVASEGEDSYRAFVKECDDGDWMRFDNISFAEGIYTSIDLYLSHTDKSGSGTVEVRLDSPAGELLGSLTPAETHCCHTFIYKPQQVSLPKITGTRSVVLRFAGGSNICQVDKIALKGSMPVSGSEETTFYVATNGSDSNDGLSLNSPFRTIQRAAEVMRPGSKCLIRGGIYRETVRPTFTGTASAPLVFEPYNSEDVVISGADPVGNWQQESGNRYTAPMDWDMGTGRNQVFVDGVMAPEAQCPNWDSGPFSIWAAEGNTVGRDEEAQTTEFVWTGYIKPIPEVDREPSSRKPACMTTEAQGLVGALTWKFGPMWASNAIVKDHGTYSNEWHNGAGLQLEQTQAWLGGNLMKMVFSGTEALMDAPGEWVRGGNTLTMLMPEGKTPSSLLIEAKRRDVVFDLSSKAYVTLRDLRFMAGSIALREANNCTIDNCHLRYLSHFTLFTQEEIGNYNAAAYTDFSNGKFGIYVSGSNNSIINSSLSLSAGSGIILNGSNLRVENCHISKCNYRGTYHAGIYVEEGDNTTITRNTIHTMGRSAIHMAGAASGAPIRITYNHLYFSGIFTGEKGLIYTYGPSFEDKGVEVAYNWMHDASGWGTGGIVLDGGGQAKWRIHHNVFWVGGEFNDELDECNICWGAGKDHNQVYNNTYIDSSKMFHNWEKAAGHNELYLWRGGSDHWQLRDIAHRDFVPTEHSPARDAGITEIPDRINPNKNTVTIGGFTLSDYVGSAPDLGAYEYGGDAWTPGATWSEPAWVYPPSSMVPVRHSSPMIQGKAPRLTSRPGTLTVTGARQGTVQIFSMAGRRVGSWKSDDRGMLQIDTRSLGASVYLVRIEAHKQPSMTSLVRVR